MKRKTQLNLSLTLFFAIKNYNRRTEEDRDSCPVGHHHDFTQYNECETPSFWGGTLKYLIDLGYNSLSTCTICFYCSVVTIDQRLDKDVVLKYYATNNTISTALRLY